MSGGLAPSKSTVYVANLPFSFTNNDLHKIFESYGQVVKITVVKDKQTRQSKGVAFVLFLNRESAYAAVRAIHNKEMFGRRLKCSIAVDNGRASEFIRRKNYVDKSRCYECGDEGHLSYQCPKNTLGEREPPKKKPKKKRLRKDEMDDKDEEEENEDSDEGEDPALDTLSAAIQFQQQFVEEEEYREKVASGNYEDLKTGESDTKGEVAPASTSGAKLSRKRIKPNNYFSDEEEEEEEVTHN